MSDAPPLGSKDPSQPLLSPLVTWMILILAAIGFAFDIYELLMLPLIAPDAVRELTGHAPGSREFQLWIGVLISVPFMVGGVVGLVGGYLTDVLGRRRVLTFSILLYALASFAAGFSDSIWMLLILRVFVLVGVCVEFVAAIAWLAELFPAGEKREKVLGYTQAFSSVGGLLVAIAYGLCVRYAGDVPVWLADWFVPSDVPEAGRTTSVAWRMTLMSGVIPALPLIILRPFLPESPAWQAKRKAGTLKRPNPLDLFRDRRLAKVTILTTLMFGTSYGIAFGAIQQTRQAVPGLPQVQADIKARQAENAERPESERRPAPAIAGQTVGEWTEGYTKLQETGGLIGRFLLAILIVRIATFQAVLRVFQGPALLIVPGAFLIAAFYNPTLVEFDWGFDYNLFIMHFGHWNITLFHVALFLAGLVTVAQFSFWGNYLPQVYPLHLRGTGESVAANIGGRVLGTSMYLLTNFIVGFVNPADISPIAGARNVALIAACVGGACALLGFVLSFFLPEPERDDPTADEDTNIPGDP